MYVCVSMLVCMHKCGYAGVCVKFGGHATRCQSWGLNSSFLKDAKQSVA